jgi:hypothetical protein
MVVTTIVPSTLSRSTSQQLLSPPGLGGSNGAGDVNSNGGGRTGSGPASGASSRSSSTAPGRKRRERAYPSAAFGGQ